MTTPHLKSLTRDLDALKRLRQQVIATDKTLDEAKATMTPLSGPMLNLVKQQLGDANRLLTRRVIDLDSQIATLVRNEADEREKEDRMERLLR